MLREQRALVEMLADAGSQVSTAPRAEVRAPADNGVENELRKVEACPARRARNPVILAVRGQERAFVGGENPSTPAIQVAQAAATEQNGIFRRDHSGALRAYPLRLFHTATSVWRDGITRPALSTGLKQAARKAVDNAPAK